MGVKLTPILTPTSVNLSELAGKKLVIDGCNLLFKYITKVRKDGQLLHNAEGDPVSHLSGLFYFIINLYERRIRPIFVFDGYPPAEKRPKSPVKIARLVQMWKLYHQREGNKRLLYDDTLFLYDKVVSDLQDLIKMMGCPVIRGITEGEAQGARLVRERKAYAMLSTDQDSLLFGCPRTIYNYSFKEEHCTYYDLAFQLNRHEITLQQLIDVALLIGTDYYPGVKGIGPKKALSYIQQYGCIEDLPRSLFQGLCGTFPGCEPDACKDEAGEIDYDSCEHLTEPFDTARLRVLFRTPATQKASPLLRAPNTKQLVYFLKTKGLNSKRVDRGIARLRLAFQQLPLRQASLLTFI